MHIGIADWIPMTASPSPRTAFRVAAVEPERSLLWLKPGSSWSEVLHDDGDRGTRLATRLRSEYSWRDPLLPLTVFLMEVADFPMMRRMLRGLKRRAERR